MAKFYETKTGLFIIAILTLVGGVFLLIMNRWIFGSWILAVSVVTFITALTKIKNKK